MADQENAPDANQDVEVGDAEAQQPEAAAPISSTIDEPQYAEPPKDTQVAVQQEEEAAGNKKPADDADRTDAAAEREDLYDADGDGIQDDEMFEGSTHSFAVYFGSKRNVSGLIISYFVIAMQMVLYIVCANQVVGDLSGDQFVIPVMVRFGKECTDTANLVCPPELPDLGYVALAAILLAFFLMHDIVAGIRVWFTIPGIWAKVAGFIIVFEALFSALIGALFAVQANSGYDAIANCVGILFIHDADEKAFEAFMVINAAQLRAGKCCQNACCQNTCMARCCRYTKLATLFITAFIIMVFALILGGAIRASTQSQIIDIYGDDYWSSHFSSSGYSWNWDWASAGGSSFTPSPTSF